MREYKGIVWTDPLPWKEVWERVQVGMPILYVDKSTDVPHKHFHIVKKKGKPKKLSLDLVCIWDNGSEFVYKGFWLHPDRMCCCIPLRTENSAEDFL